MNWEDHAARWPNAAVSRFVDTRSNRWHVQIMGDGPSVVLIHGAGGSTHSWRDVMPILAQSCQVVALDLPGQGFTKNHHRTRLSLPAMSQDIEQLLEELDIEPEAMIGHSAGAAIMFQMALSANLPKSCKLVSINGALGNFDGIAGLLFPIMAKFLSMNPLTALIFSKTAASEKSARRLIASTGSTIDINGLAYYQALFSDRIHVDNTLAMMAQWSLDGLTDKMKQLPNDILFLVGSRDAAVPPSVSRDTFGTIQTAQFEQFETAGHLLHEELPSEVAARVLKFLNVA